MTGLTFVIRYGGQHGHEDQALALARRLFAVYDEAIDSLALLPTDEDDFSLAFDGTILTSLRRDGQPPTVADVRRVLAERVSTAAPRPEP